MVTRIGGLASGMDIDSMVEKLMQAEKAPLNKLYQSKQKYEWQRDAYRDVNKKLKSFDDFLFNDMTLQKDMYKKSITSTNSSISATPTTAENGQTLSINSVSQIAKSSTAVAKDKIAANTAGTTKLGDLNLGLFDGAETKEIKLKVIQQDGTLADKTVTLSKTDSINDMISKFKKDAGVNAFYDEKSGQIALSTKHTGVGEKVTGNSYTVTTTELPDGGVDKEITTHTSSESTSLFVSEGTDFLAKLGFANSQFLGEGGQNAKININGADIERSSNTFDIDGFKVTLNDTYTGSQPVTLTTKTDTDNMVDKIKKFVETYNGLIESFTASTKEKKYRDFPPLTDEQKKDMEESDIKAWEEKAKSGVLRSDSLITSTLSKMRSLMYESGGSSNSLMNSLYSMGITTSNKTSDNGKLVIDEEKLRAAIEKDPEAVFKTFSNSSDDQPGIVQKLRKSINTSVISIEKKAGKAESVNNTFNLGRTLNDVETRISAWKTKLENIEQRYWKQFGAMESAINKGNQQSAMLFSGQTQ